MGGGREHEREEGDGGGRRDVATGAQGMADHAGSPDCSEVAEGMTADAAPAGVVW